MRQLTNLLETRKHSNLLQVSDGSYLEVNPKQIQGEDSAPLGSVPIRMPYEHNGNKNKGKRKHMKIREYKSQLFSALASWEGESYLSA